MRRPGVPGMNSPEEKEQCWYVCSFACRMSMGASPFLGSAGVGHQPPDLMMIMMVSLDSSRFA